MTPSFISARKKCGVLPWSKSISCSIQPKSRFASLTDKSDGGNGSPSSIKAKSAGNSRTPQARLLETLPLARATRKHLDMLGNRLILARPCRQRDMGFDHISDIFQHRRRALLAVVFNQRIENGDAVALHRAADLAY